MKLCKYCGNELEDNAKFCGKCGKPQVDDEKETAAVPGDEVSIKAAPQYEDNEKSILKKEGVELAKLLVKKDIDIADGEEKKFYRQEIILSANINCLGSVIFDHCVLVYNGDSITGKIILEDSASFTMTHCTVVGKNNKTPIEYSDDYLVEGDGEKAIIENSLFYDCKYFAKFYNNTSVTVENCVVKYSKLPPLFKFIKCGGESTRMLDCLFENFDSRRLRPESKYEYPNEYILEGIQNVSMCTFKKLIGCISSAGEKLIVTNCAFDQCIGLIKGGSATKITNCIFKDSEQIIDILMADGEVRNCQFFGCRNRLLNVMSGMGLGNTEFSNCEIYNYANKDGWSLIGAIHFNYVDSGRGIISKCKFDGMNFADNTWLVTCQVNKASQTNAVLIDGCTFAHCITRSGSNEIIKCSSTVFGLFGSSKEIDVVNINNCKGLASVNKKGQADKAEDVKVVYETSSGEPIGANANEIIAGVPGFDYMQEKNEQILEHQKKAINSEWAEITDNLSEAKGIWEMPIDEQSMEAFGIPLNENEGIKLQSICLKIDDAGDIADYILCNFKSFVKRTAEENGCSMDEIWANVIEEGGESFIPVGKYEGIIPTNLFDNFDFSTIELHRTREKLKVIRDNDELEFIFKKSKLMIE